MAQTLFDNSAKLTKIDDPATEADRFNDIADKLVARMDAATAANDEKRLVQLANSCRRLAEEGVDANIQRAIDAGNLDLAGEEKLEYVILRDANRTNRLASIMERNPEASRKAIHKAMKGHHSHKGKKYLKTTK